MLPRCSSTNLLCFGVIKIGYQPAKGVSSPLSQLTVLTVSPTLINFILLSFCLIFGNSFPTHAQTMTEHKGIVKNFQGYMEPSSPPPATLFGWYAHPVMQALLIYLLKRKNLRHLGRNFRSCTRKIETLLCLALYLEIPHKHEQREGKKTLGNFFICCLFCGSS